jgi:hypothetical protein
VESVYLQAVTTLSFETNAGSLNKAENCRHHIAARALYSPLTHLVLPAGLEEGDQRRNNKVGREDKKGRTEGKRMS